MAISKKLEIIYHNGQPDGIRSIRRHLSTMTTYVIPRPLLSEAKKLTGINRPGIYYLISENDDNKIHNLTALPFRHLLCQSLSTFKSHSCKLLISSGICFYIKVV